MILVFFVIAVLTVCCNIVAIVISIKKKDELYASIIILFMLFSIFLYLFLFRHFMSVLYIEEYEARVIGVQLYNLVFSYFLYAKAKRDRGE